MLVQLKQILREKSINYSQLAMMINVSESTVKRMLSTGKLSLDRFAEILEALEVDLSQLLQRIEQQHLLVSQLSYEQEQELLKDHLLLLTSFLAINHWRPEEIIETYKIEQHQLTRLLAKLDKIGIIELGLNNHIKPLISRNFKWRKQGPIERFFAHHVQPEFLDSTFEQDGELRHFTSGMLSKNSIMLLHKQLDKLAGSVDELVSQDANLPVSDRYGVSILLAFRPWEHSMFSRFRRGEITKVYKA